MSVCEIAISIKMLEYVYRFLEICIISLSLALIHSRYATEYNPIQCIVHLAPSRISIRGSAFTSRSIHALSLIHPAVSLDHVHTLRTLIPKVFSSSLFPSLFFVHFTLLADSRTFSLVRHFPTKSESPYLARKKKFYHSVSTCSSTSFSPSHSVVCRLLSITLGLLCFFLR